MHKLQNAITSPEIAQIIKRRIITVHRWAESGKLPNPKYVVGRVFLWDRLEVFKALESLGYMTASNDALYSENQEVQK